MNLFQFVEKNAKDTKENTQEDKIQKKEPKHIYNKQTKKDEQDIMVDEVHSYREKVDDGYYSRERMSSYVFYEAPKGGAASESAGKSQKTQTEDAQNKDTKKEENVKKEENIKKEENVKTDEGKKL